MKDDIAIVTGQQIGLLGGRLLNLYKVLGAAHLAKQLGRKAIYWLEGNDADFNEISSVPYINKFGKLKTLRWKKDSKGQRIGDMVIDKALLHLQKSFFEDIVQTPRTAYLRNLCSEVFAEGTTLMNASLKFAGILFKGLGIEFFDSTKADFLSSSKPILLREAERTPIGEQANLFALVNGKREAVFRSKEGFLTRRGATLDLDKETLLPNVRTRSLLQNAYFRTSHYVAGSSEAKYLKALGPLHKFHGIAPATIVLRTSITLLDPKMDGSIEGLGMGKNNFATQPKEELAKQYLLKHEGWTTSGLKQSTKALTNTYIKGLLALGLEVKDIERSLYLQFKERIGFMRKAVKQKHQAQLKSINTLSDWILPYGELQERMFCPPHAMNTYGLDLIERLRHHCEPGRGHQFVAMT